MNAEELVRQLVAERWGPTPLRALRRESTRLPQPIPRATGTDDPQADGDSVEQVQRRRAVLMGDDDEVRARVSHQAVA